MWRRIFVWGAIKKETAIGKSYDFVEIEVLWPKFKLLEPCKKGQNTEKKLV